MTINFDELTKNRFGLLFDLRKAFKPQKTFNGYIRISSTGKCPLFDYNCGVLSVEVSTVGYGRGLLDKSEEVDDINYVVLFTIGCADDGLWQAWSKVMPKEKCQLLVERIKTEILDYLSSLPTYEELNNILKVYGLYGECT